MPRLAIPIADFDVPYAAPMLAKIRADATPTYPKNYGYDILSIGHIKR